MNKTSRVEAGSGEPQLNRLKEKLGPKKYALLLFAFISLFPVLNSIACNDMSGGTDSSPKPTPTFMGGLGPNGVDVPGHNPKKWD